jgi:membrane protein
MPPSTPRSAVDRGRDASAPWRIPILGWKDIAWRTYRAIGRDRLPSVAGGVTFFLLLAIFPALAAFVSVYGLFLDLGRVERQLDQMAAILPREAVGLIGGQMVRLANRPGSTLGAAFVGSTLASIWSANAGMKALFDGLNVAYGETEKRPFLHRTLVSYAATLSVVVFLVVVVAMTVAAPIALHAFGLHGLRLWWAPLRWLIVYVIAALAFTLIYRFGPSRAPARWRWVYCGGALAALVWLVGSLVFSTYIDTFTALGVTYGSLGAMVALMLWLWFSLMVVLIGAVLNAEIEHQTAHDTTTGEPEPLGQRGATVADTIGGAFTTSFREAGEWLWAFLRRQVASLARVVRRARS